MRIQRADPHARRAALRTIIAGAIIGTVVVLAFRIVSSMLEAGAASDPAAVKVQARLLLIALAIIVGGSLAAFAIYLWRLGARIKHARRFPPPGERTVRDTPVLEGDAAVTRGRLAQGFGAMLTIAAVAVLVMLWRLARLLG
jgi:hypothetical protein